MPIDTVTRIGTLTDAKVNIGCNSLHGIRAEIHYVQKAELKDIPVFYTGQASINGYSVDVWYNEGDEYWRIGDVTKRYMQNAHGEPLEGITIVGEYNGTTVSNNSNNH